MVYPNWLRPFAEWIICVDVEIATCRYICCGHIEGTVMVAKSGGKNALRACALLEQYLACASETMPYLSPVNQIATVKDGDAWKIFAGAGDKVIILTYAADTRIGVKAG